jgi:hypothetical protein
VDAFHRVAQFHWHRAIQNVNLLVAICAESDQLPKELLQRLEYLSADKFQHGLDHKYELQRFERHMFRGLRVQLKYLSYHRYSLRQMHRHLEFQLHAIHLGQSQRQSQSYL